jgi:cell division protein FtsB
VRRIRRRFGAKPLTRRRKVTLALLATLPVLAIFTFGNRGLLTRFRLEMQRDRLHEQLYSERASGDSLRLEIARHRDDSATIERIARERFGMVRPGETIYRVDE